MKKSGNAADVFIYEEEQKDGRNVLGADWDNEKRDRYWDLMRLGYLIRMTGIVRR